MKPRITCGFVAALVLLGGCGLLEAENEAESFGLHLGYGFAEQAVTVEVDGVAVLDGVMPDGGMEGLLPFLESARAEPRWGARAIEVFCGGERYATEVEARDRTDVIITRSTTGVEFEVSYGGVPIEG